MIHKIGEIYNPIKLLRTIHTVNNETKVILSDYTTLSANYQLFCYFILYLILPIKEIL